MNSADRVLAPVMRRIDNMVARGVLRATVDDGGIQRMQLGLLEDETADRVERIQNYGLSANPPAGGDALVVFVQGNRDHGVVLAVNDRGSRPKDLRGGEVILYNDQSVSVLLNADGDLVLKAKRNITIETDEEITVKAQKLTVEVPEIAIKGDIALDGNLSATGTVSWSGLGGGGP